MNVLHDNVDLTNIIWHFNIARLILRHSFEGKNRLSPLSVKMNSLPALWFLYRNLEYYQYHNNINKRFVQEEMFKGT